MSSFTRPLIVEIASNGKEYKLMLEFIYYLENNPNELIKVPFGFVTDFASIPQLFYRIWHPIGKYAKAAVIHDYLYTAGNNYECIYTDRKQVDKIFLEAMKVSGVNVFTRYIFYYCVRWFAKNHWRK